MTIVCRLLSSGDVQPIELGVLPVHLRVAPYRQGALIYSWICLRFACNMAHSNNHCTSVKLPPTCGEVSLMKYGNHMTEEIYSNSCSM
jgi:hypothetical protein